MRIFGSQVSFCLVYVTSKRFEYLLKTTFNVPLCQIKRVKKELCGGATLSRLSCRRRYVILDQQFPASNYISSKMFAAVPQKFPSFGVGASSLLFRRPNQAQLTQNCCCLLFSIKSKLGHFKKWLKFDGRNNAQAYPGLIYHTHSLFIPFWTSQNALRPVEKCVLVLVTTEFG